MRQSKQTGRNKGTGRQDGVNKDIRAAVTFVLFFAFVFCGACLVSFYLTPPLPKAPSFIRPYTEETLTAVENLREIEKQVAKDAFDGATLRADIANILPAMNITGISTKAGKDGLIVADVKGLVRAENVQDLLMQLNRPAMDVTSMKLSSRLSFNVRTNAPFEDVVFDATLKLLFVNRANMGK